MGNLWVRINYSILAAVIRGLKTNIALLEKCLDEGFAESTKAKSIICTRVDCPNRTEE